MHVSRQWKIMSLSGKEKQLPKPSIYSQNSLLSTWWNMKDNITCVLMEHGRTITEDICCKQINRVNETLLRMRGKKKLYYSSGRQWNCILYETNPRKIWSLRWEVLSHSPISPHFNTDKFTFNSKTWTFHKWQHSRIRKNSHTKIFLFSGCHRK